jgi:hypothetical protein
MEETALLPRGHVVHIMMCSAISESNPNHTFQYLTHLDPATNAGQRGLDLSTRYIIPLTICGDNRRIAQTDVRLLDRVIGNQLSCSSVRGLGLSNYDYIIFFSVS